HRRIGASFAPEARDKHEVCGSWSNWIPCKRGIEGDHLTNRVAKLRRDEIVECSRVRELVFVPADVYRVHRIRWKVILYEPARIDHGKALLQLRNRGEW